MAGNGRTPARGDSKTGKASKVVTKVTTNFVSVHLPLIKAGSQQELQGWFSAYDECMARIADENDPINSVRDYATASAGEWSFGTIRTYIGYCQWSEDNGYKRDWLAMEQIKNTRYQKVASKPAPKQTAKAIDDAKASFKSMSKKDRQAFLAWAIAQG